MDIHSNLSFGDRLQGTFINWKNSDSITRQVGSHVVGSVAMLTVRICEFAKEIFCALYQAFGKIIHGLLLAIPNTILWLEDKELYANRFSLTLALKHMGEGIRFGIDAPASFLNNLCNPNWNENKVESKKLKKDLAGTRKRIDQLTNPTVGNHLAGIKKSLGNVTVGGPPIEDPQQLAEDLEDALRNIIRLKQELNDLSQKLEIEKIVREDLAAFFVQNGGKEDVNYVRANALLCYIGMFIDNLAKDNDSNFLEGVPATPELNQIQHQTISDFLEFSLSRKRTTTALPTPLTLGGSPNSPPESPEQSESDSPFPTTPLYSTMRRRLGNK